MNFFAEVFDWMDDWIDEPESEAKASSRLVLCVLVGVIVLTVLFFAAAVILTYGVKYPLLLGLPMGVLVIDGIRRLIKWIISDDPKPTEEDKT